MKTRISLLSLAVISAIILPAVSGASSSYPDFERLNYLNWFAECTSPVIDGESELFSPRFDPFDDRDESFDLDDMRVTVRGVRHEGGASDLHVRFSAPRRAFSPCPVIALYRSNQRVEKWSLNPWANSFRDSLAGGPAPDSSTTQFLDAQQRPDSSVRLTFRAQARTGARCGKIHQFALVFLPRDAGYRLSHVEECFALVFDADHGTIQGSGEARMRRGDETVLERREIRVPGAVRSACDVDGLARRLARARVASPAEIRDIDCLRGAGHLLSRRSETRPTELYDEAMR